VVIVGGAVAVVVVVGGDGLRQNCGMGAVSFLCGLLLLPPLSSPSPPSWPNINHLSSAVDAVVVVVVDDVIAVVVDAVVGSLIVSMFVVVVVVAVVAMCGVEVVSGRPCVDSVGVD